MWPFKKHKIIRNRKVTKARFLYLYIIFGSLSGFIYFLLSLILGLPKIYSLVPLFILVGFVVLWFIYNNWKLIWFFIIDTDRGKFRLILDKFTVFSDSKKLRISKWVYLDKKTVRIETWGKLSKKVIDGEELTKEEKILYNSDTIMLPLEVMDNSINELLFRNALIHTHINMKPLDDELRKILDLSDEKILAFDFNKELEKINGTKDKKLIEIGKRKSLELNN